VVFIKHYSRKSRTSTGCYR